MGLRLVCLVLSTLFDLADTFRSERLRKLDLHQGFVKGVCWDPVGEFLATQSDDRTVKIWKTSDWSIEAEVKKPFEDSPGSTFFRRLRCESYSLGLSLSEIHIIVGRPTVHISQPPTRPTIKDTFSSLLSLLAIHGHQKSV